MDGSLMDGLSTEQIMSIGLDLGGMTELPGDSAIYVAGDGLRRVMMGIDIGAAELQLATTLGVGGVIAHHPAGGAAELGFPRVLSRQIDFLVDAGVPMASAQAVVQPRIAALLLRAQAANHDHVPSVARLLGLPFLNIHLSLDEAGRRVMGQAIERGCSGLGREPTVADVVDALRTIPEIRDAATRVMVPIGRLDNPAGKIVVFHGAGTNGGFAVADALFTHGIGTVVYIHLAPDDAQRLAALGRSDVNVVVSGHIASDMIGINLFVAALERRGVEVVRMSGL